MAPGQQLVAMSDPIRYTEMIELGDSPSPRFVRDAIRLRRGPTIDLVFAPSNAAVTAAAAAAAAAASESSSESSGESGLCLGRIVYISVVEL